MLHRRLLLALLVGAGVLLVVGVFLAKTFDNDADSGGELVGNLCLTGSFLLAFSTLLTAITIASYRRNVFLGRPPPMAVVVALIATALWPLTLLVWAGGPRLMGERYPLRQYL